MAEYKWVSLNNKRKKKKSWREKRKMEPLIIPIVATRLQGQGKGWPRCNSCQIEFTTPGTGRVVGEDNCPHSVILDNRVKTFKSAEKQTRIVVSLFQTNVLIF
jgi:hypothetical protein